MCVCLSILLHIFSVVLGFVHLSNWMEELDTSHINFRFKCHPEIWSTDKGKQIMGRTGSVTVVIEGSNTKLEHKFEVSVLY